MHDQTRKEILPGVFLNCVQTGKFKTCYMSLSLLRPLSGDEAAKNSLLPRVLSRGTSAYPTMEKLSARSDELYGASIVPAVRKKGEVQCVGFAASFIDDAFTDDKELLEKVVELVGQLLLDPVTRGGRFLAEYVDSEKDKLIEDIRSIVNDKRAYSVRALIKNMCADEPFGTANLGTVKDVEAITGSKLYKHYQDILAHSRIEIFYCGGAAPERLEAAFLRAMSTLPRGDRVEVYTTQGGPVDKIRTITERTDATQSNLVMGFRTGCTVTGKEYPAYALMNAVFGGSATSKLFMNVREKLSLCYYANSSMQKHKGIIIVSSGIKREDYQQAYDEILAQFEAIRSGDITDEELDTARKGIIGSLRTVKDAPGLMEEYNLSDAIEDTQTDPEEFIELISKVTRDDVIRAALGTELDTVFFLKGN